MVAAIDAAGVKLASSDGDAEKSAEEPADGVAVGVVLANLAALVAGDASMEVLTGAFDASHARLLEVLPEIDPECFSADLPEGRYRDFFGTVGNAVTFITCSHPMMHLGQVSMWRRAMGLGSCM